MTIEELKIREHEALQRLKLEIIHYQQTRVGKQFLLAALKDASEKVIRP